MEVVLGFMAQGEGGGGGVLITTNPVEQILINWKYCRGLQIFLNFIKYLLQI